MDNIQHPNRSKEGHVDRHSRVKTTRVKTTRSMLELSLGISSSTINTKHVCDHHALPPSPSSSLLGEHIEACIAHPRCAPQARLPETRK
ncbi:hypothetical protein V6N12_020480 [Hibiscus sabdariffa]|uniref:Uncharacterized protein n=1 Tax=Hibiscus sabdariffa TaxID=183260 RepID=A0ABR2CY85_9ROSI